MDRGADNFKKIAGLQLCEMGGCADGIGHAGFSDGPRHARDARSRRRNDFGMRAGGGGGLHRERRQKAFAAAPAISRNPDCQPVGFFAAIAEMKRYSNFC